MRMFMGLDFGTSSVKGLLMDEGGVLATASMPLAISRPTPGHSEQHPDWWWTAMEGVIGALRRAQPEPMRRVRGIGLSGQMHGAVLLDERDEVLRPAILWNDTRAAAECGELLRACPALPSITGNPAMPGFTAPKILWVRRHEPEVFARLRRVLLPKAWVRLRMTGEAIEDMSDASGTLWLDVGNRVWSPTALAATGLTEAHMPRLVEGSAPAGRLRPELARSWGFGEPPLLAGGAGDNAAGAVGLGAVAPGSAFVSLGTSGVLWATTDRFRPNPEAAVHAFCHALPGLWHQMGVTLSAASALAWWSGVTGLPEAALLDELPPLERPSPALFLPYLSGERTPHNDAAIRGAFVDLSHDCDRPALTQAVLEGVAFSMRDCQAALAAAGTRIERADVIGGGSRSAAWIAILASVMDTPIRPLAGGDHGGALGAARLARLAVDGGDAAAVCAAPARLAGIAPRPALVGAYAERHARYRSLYAALRPGQ